jgi:hypothetical protein
MTIGGNTALPGGNPRTSARTSARAQGAPVGTPAREELPQAQTAAGAGTVASAPPALSGLGRPPARPTASAEEIQQRRTLPGVGPAAGAGTLRSAVGRQVTLQGEATVLGAKRAFHAVPSHYASPTGIQALGTRHAMPRTPRVRQSAAQKTAAALAKGKRLDAAKVAAARRALATQLPALAQNAEHLDIAAQALAAVGPQADAPVTQVLGEIAKLDFQQLESGALPLAQQSARTPVSQAVAALMVMSRASPLGCEVAAGVVAAARAAAENGAAGAADSPTAADLARLAAGPLDIETRPAQASALLSQLNTQLDAGAANGSAGPVTAQAERQLAALAIHQTCGGNAELATQVAQRLPNYDLGAALQNTAPADAVELATQQTLMRMVGAGGTALIAAQKMAAGPGNPVDVPDLRLLAQASQALMGDGVQSLQQVMARAAQVSAAVTGATPAPAATASGAGGAGAAGAAGPASVAALASPTAAAARHRPGLGAQWPSANQLAERGVAADMVEQRLPALALMGLQAKRQGSALTVPQRAAVGAVRNGLTTESGKLAFANEMTQKLAQWIQPSANAGLAARATANRAAQDPVMPLVEFGPLGSLNNLAVPQFGMKQSLAPMLELASRVATAPADVEGGAKPLPQQHEEFGTVALLEQWNKLSQGQQGKEVNIKPEHLQNIATKAADLAGVSAQDRPAFEAAVRQQYEGKLLNQETLRALYDTTVDKVKLMSPSLGEAAAEVQTQMDALDKAMVLATGTPKDYDQHFANEVPAFGRGAMGVGAQAKAARNNNRMGAMAEVMRQFGTSSGLNMTSYAGGGVPDPGTIATAVAKYMAPTVLSGPVSGGVVLGPSYSGSKDNIVRMGAGATGIEFNYGVGRSHAVTAAVGGSVGVKTYPLAGNKQRAGGGVSASGSYTSTQNQSVFLRVPRTAASEGGVPGAAAGSASDTLRTEYLANAMEHLGELLESGDPNPLLSLLAEHDVLSLGVANGPQDFSDVTAPEWNVSANASLGIGSFKAGPVAVGSNLSASVSKSWTGADARTLAVRSHGRVDAQREQKFSMQKYQHGVGVGLGNRPTPVVASATHVPQSMNYPTSMAYLRTEIDGIMNRGGTYWSYETESLPDMRKHFEVNGPRYAQDMVSLRKDLTAIREQKLEAFKAEGGHSQAEVSAHAEQLLDDDEHVQLETLRGMFEERAVDPGLSYRGTAEISAAAIEQANDLMAAAQLARQSPDTQDLAQAKEAELQTLLRDPDSYVNNDIGFRINTFDKQELNVAGLAFSGMKIDARTNADRAKI